MRVRLVHQALADLAFCKFLEGLQFVLHAQQLGAPQLAGFSAFYFRRCALALFDQLFASRFGQLPRACDVPQ